MNAATVSSFVDSMRRVWPRLGLGLDIMTGFPGESDAAYAATAAFLAAQPITYAHVFPYSRRPSTLAASMREQLPGPVKEARVRRLRALDAEKRQAMYANNIGRVHQVLVERRQSKTGLLQGFSENYVPILFAGGSGLIRKVGHVRVFSALGSMISAVLVVYPVAPDWIVWSALRVLIGFSSVASISPPKAG